MKIGDRIRYRREELGMSQEELAEKLGYRSRSSINKIEKDASGLPQSKIAAIASALKTTPSYIMGWEDVEKNNDAIADIIVRMRNDQDFFVVVQTLYELEPDKIHGVKELLNAFLK